MGCLSEIDKFGSTPGMITPPTRLSLVITDGFVLLMVVKRIFFCNKLLGIYLNSKCFCSKPLQWGPTYKNTIRLNRRHLPSGRPYQ